MKKVIITLTIIILAITSCISTGIAIYVSNNYVKIPSQYRCETDLQSVDNMNYNQIIVLNINKEQYIENYQSINTSIFSNQEQYEVAKTIENTDTVTYSFDDDKMTMLADYGTSYIQNDSGEKINIWYKEYIKNLETAGYTCKLVK